MHCVAFMYSSNIEAAVYTYHDKCTHQIKNSLRMARDTFLNLGWVGIHCYSYSHASVTHKAHSISHDYAGPIVTPGTINGTFCPRWNHVTLYT